MSVKDLQKILFTSDDIAKIVQQVATKIVKNYSSKPEKLILIAPLKGSFMFLSDLSREINRQGLPHIIDFLTVQSYQGTHTTGNVKILSDLREDISGANVIIVEDIIDTGLTLQKLLMLMKSRNPNSLEICTLLRKPTENKTNVQAQYVGVDIDPEFVVGYGLDYNEWFRGLDCIGVPTTETIERYK